jgi:hypothetical protein
MNERQKLRHDLARYKVLRQLTSDERAITALDDLMKETLDRLNRIDDEIDGPDIRHSN